MATYTVQAPDGKTLTLEGPEGASQDEIISQAQKLYTPQQSNPQQTVAPTPQAAPATNTPAQPDMPIQDPNSGALNLPLVESQSAPPTRDQQLAQMGKDLSDQAGGSDLGKGLLGGLRAFPGANYLAAGLERFLPGAITGNNSDASFDDILKVIQARTAADQEKSLVGNLAGQVGGALGGFGLLGKGVGAAAEAGVPAANFLQRLGTFEKGADVANAAKGAALGSAAGAATAANAGDDVGTGAAIGAAVPIGASLLGRYVARPAADILGLTKATDYIKRFTSASTTELRQRLADYRARTGAEPTMFELLPKTDQDNIVSHLIAGRPATVEQVSNAVQQRAANVGPEMQDLVRGATQRDTVQTQRQLYRDLAAANGGTTAPGDAAMALRASQSPTDMLALRREESRRIMAPHDDAQVVENFSDLLPQEQVPGRAGEVISRETDPEISRALRSVSAGSQVRPRDEGISVRDVTNMISDLRDDAMRGGIEGRAANQAANHLMDVLQENVPQAAAATQRMRDAYAASSRMAEGMGEGWQQRLRNEIQVGTNNSRARGVGNAFDSEEGTAGRQLGQVNRLNSALSGNTQDALATTIDIGRGGARSLAPNLGQTAADTIEAGAQAQAQSIEGLKTALSRANGNGEALTGENIAQAILALNPHTFAFTKARALKMLASGTFLPASRARTVADMLFSQDPRMTQRAIDALGKTTQGRAISRGIGALIGNNMNETSRPGISANGSLPPLPEFAPEGAPAAAPQAAATPTDGSSPYAAQLEKINQTENPDLLNLIERQSSQESGGRQTDEKGQPITSKKGAIGVMQVMPDTAPEAARLAGLPWDAKAYRADGTYNKLLGIAYMSEMLRRYDGDVGKALAAYNAGSRRVDNAVHKHGENWLAGVPAETQDYVQRVS